jgi:DNA modification methylase
LWSNPNDIVFTPFLGIGSEVYGAVQLGRKGIGIELKPSYVKQAVKNLNELKSNTGSFWL